MRAIFVIGAILMLAAIPFTCEPGKIVRGRDLPVTPPVEPPTEEPVPNPDSVILAEYEAEARAYQTAHGLPVEWVDWVIAHKNWYSMAYVRARVNPKVIVMVRYDTQIPYNPPWADEAEHFAALARLAELQNPGWEFVFQSENDGADMVATLGYTGWASYANGRDVFLIWETIFTHEFSHNLGIEHHYCYFPGDAATCANDVLPPGEGRCIMSRNGSIWGPTERFVLNLPDELYEEEIGALTRSIIERYPRPWP